MRRLAEAGNTAHELMAISGHKTLTEVQRYTNCKIARNTDPLRGDIASNSDPF